MGKFFVTPSSHKTPCGRFKASFALQRSKENSKYCCVFRFDKTFSSNEAAKIFAVTQGWLQASMQS